MQQNIGLNVSQTTTLSARLQQALNILQYSNAELMLEIESALDSNFLLEREGGDASVLSVLEDNSFNQYDDYFYKKDSSINKDVISLYSESINLKDYLNWQLGLSTYSNTDKKIGQTIIDALDENGYLQLTIEEVKQSLKFNFKLDVSIQDILVVLHYIQNLEPPGIAARSVKECLLLQLKNIPHNTPWLKESVNLIENYLDLLAKKKYDVLMRKLNVSDAQLKAIISLIKSLNPKPGLMINNSTENFITPELIAKKEHHEWNIYLGSNHSNILRVADSCFSLLKSVNNEKDKEHIKSLYHDARFLIKCIEDRNSTILKVARAVFKHQQDFLNFGEKKIKTLNLNIIAKELHLNVSTISRAVSNKHISTPYGNFALKNFFATAINADNKNISNKDVMYKLQEIIASEDKFMPFTDQQLVQNLANSGIVIARRTITKYRELLGISSSNMRIRKDCN